MRISVIVPTLNEAATIEATLSRVMQQGPEEIIVVDAGSTDDTVALSLKYANVVQSEAGRSTQMNAGSLAASGDVLVFLHADTLLPADGIELIKRSIESGARSGIFRLQFDYKHPLLSFSAFCTRIRSLNICFGDRCIFCSKEVFEGIGGFPPIPIFEDVEFAKRVASTGKFDFLDADVVTSARRYQTAGVWRQQWSNLILWTRYQLGGDPDILARKYLYD